MGVPVRMTLLLQLIELSAVYVWFAARERAVSIGRKGRQKGKKGRTGVLETVTFVGEKKPNFGVADFLSESAELLVGDDDDCEGGSGGQYEKREEKEAEIDKLG
jgi:hypothetical protein